MELARIEVINAHERDPRVYVAGMREAEDAVAHDGLDPSPLYTHVFSLDQIDQAMKVTRSRPDRFLNFNHDVNAHKAFRLPQPILKEIR